MRALILSSAAALGLAAPAMAGGMNAPAPEMPVTVAPAPVSPSYDWTGFYVGGQLGFGDVNTDGAANVDGDGVLGGVHAGYNWDFGNVVLGAEVDYDTSDIELDGGAGTIDDVARARLRAGYDFGNGVLAYGALGGAYAGATIGGVEQEDTGWLAGAGVAYDMGNNWVVGGDVTYHQFDDFDGTGVDVDVTTATARVSYRF
ncbi:outer membrane beta-barrel protein [Rhodobacterales bacterium HKCCE3408]|nr:outer membrane beta-barrel protein [Rhodobacterales bacterium HKCCE3408]